MRELRADTAILEFTISQNPRDIVESILKQNSKIVGFGVYIWNTKPTQDVVSILKRVRPDIRVILGGPEVSYETEIQEICRLADLTIQGEADHLFYKICQAYLRDLEWPASPIIKGELPELKALQLPYSLYSDEDIRNRVIYVEASRGCPYKCEYCLSSLDKSVRSFDLDIFLGEMDLLIKRGVRQFKFVDRTFNLSIVTSTKILQFYLERMSLGLFLHFEMVPDRLPVELRDLLKLFPAGSLQFEVGIQTWNPEVAKLVSRRQDYQKIGENFQFLNSDTQVHTHADLIVGLPGETLESFAQGFDAVSELKPHEIQVGILKRLRGTPIIRHDVEWKMVYQDSAPYQVLSTRTMSYQTLQEMNRFAHFWNLIANSGNFKSTFVLLTHSALGTEKKSLFWEFSRLTRYLSEQHPQGHGISLHHLMESVCTYFIEIKKHDPSQVRNALLDDYNLHAKRPGIPAFLRGSTTMPSQPRRPKSATPERQQKHLAQHEHERIN